MHLMCRTGLKPCGLHSGIKPLEVLGLKTVDPVSAETGDQVPVHGGAVTEVGLVTHRWLSHVLEPMSQPSLDRPCEDSERIRTLIPIESER
jgi:hypothetical protein